MDKYSEALERAKQGLPIDEIFPELKESEDEQSKKWILEYLYDGLRKSDEQFKGQFKAAIAWLEKQGEQNPTRDYSTLEITDVVRQALQECEDYRNIRADLYAARVGATVETLIQKQGGQKPAEWSEGDKMMIKHIIDIIKRAGYYAAMNTAFYVDEIAWLKSLRPHAE